MQLQCTQLHFATNRARRRPRARNEQPMQHALASTVAHATQPASRIDRRAVLAEPRAAECRRLACGTPQQSPTGREMASIKTSKHATTMLGEPIQFLTVSQSKPDVYNDKKGEQARRFALRPPRRPRASHSRLAEHTQVWSVSFVCALVAGSAPFRPAYGCCSRHADNPVTRSATREWFP